MKRVRHIYPEVDTDRVQYQLARVMWFRTIGEIARELSQGEWQSWQADTFADGVTPIPREFNPICEVRSPARDRVIQIYQSSPESDELEIAAWTGTYPMADDSGEDVTPVPELVINLSLSEESAAVARELLTVWMSGVATARMDQTIREVLSRTSAGQDRT